MVDNKRSSLIIDLVEYGKELYNFGSLKGKTFKKVERVGKQEGMDRIIFTEAENDQQWKLYHAHDCCESVSIEDITGNLEDLIGSPILLAEEVTNVTNQGPLDKSHISYTWTFYKLATIKGSVTIRWYGESNGCYSEAVDFCQIPKEWPE